MGIYEFNQLTTEEKVDIASEDGIFLTNGIWGQFGVSLYGLDGFYIEVWLDRSTNKVDRVNTFKSTKMLEPYLDEIEINIL